jgi:hypothetical protein
VLLLFEGVATLRCDRYDFHDHRIVSGCGTLAIAARLPGGSLGQIPRTTLDAVKFLESIRGRWKKSKNNSDLRLVRRCPTMT